MQAGPSCLTDPAKEETKPPSTPLEGDIQEMKAQLSKEREEHAKQVGTLLKEVESLNKYQEREANGDDVGEDKSPEQMKNLQDDFDIMHQMYEDKVDEMHGLQKEMENQMELEKNVENLKTLLVEEKNKCSLHLSQVQQLQQQLEYLVEQNEMLKQSREKAAISDQSQADGEELKNKIQDLIHDEAQKRVSKAEERLKQEHETMLGSVSQKHKEEMDLVKELLREHEEKVQENVTELDSVKELLRKHEEKIQEHLKEGVALRSEIEHLKRVHALELETKQKLNRIVADYKEKIMQVIRQSEQREAELRRHLTNLHQEELVAVQENAVSELDAERRSWMEEKKRLEARHEGEKQEMVRRNESNLLDLEARYKSESATLTNSYELRFKKLADEKESLMKQSEIKVMEENYQEQIKHLWSMLHRYKAQSLLISRESTPDSDATASSQATSTGDDQDGLPKRLQKLFNKVLQEGIEVLTLTECEQLRDHLAPGGGIDGKGDVSVQNMDLWQKEKDLILEQVKMLNSLTFMGSSISQEKILRNVFILFQKEKDRIILELEMFAHRPFAPIDVDNLDVKIRQLESQLHSMGNYLSEIVAHSKLSFDKEKMRNEKLEQQVGILKEQVEKDSWQIKTQKEMNEFRLKQQKNQIGELVTALDSEKLHNSKLQSQLQEQRNVCTELQLSLSTAQAEVARLQHLLNQVKKEAENIKNFYDMEKSHTLSLMQALEMERASFSQVQMTLECERRQNKALHSQSQQVIQELKSSASRYSSEMMSPPEIARAGFDSHRSLEFLIPSLSLQENLTNNSTKCLRCNVLKSTLDTERIAWANQEATLAKSLRSLEEQLKMKSQQSRGELSERPEAVVGRNKFLSLYYKLRRSEHHRLALINQKKYLSRLLNGFEMTESATLHILNEMGKCTPQNSLCSYSSRTESASCNRFRVAVYTVVATLRLKFLVRRTKKTLKFVDSVKLKSASHSPSSSSPYLNNWVTERKNGFSPSLSSNSSLSSGTPSLPTSVPRQKYRTSLSLQGTSFRGSVRSEDINSVPLFAQPSSKLTDCVTRLSHLHRTLGLDEST